MKNILNLTCLIVAFVTMSLSSFAQPRGTVATSKQHLENEVFDCAGSFVIEISTTNLGDYDPPTNNNVFDQLPYDMPQMFFEYTLGDETHTIPVVDFVHLGGTSDPSIWVSYHTISFDFCDECDYGGSMTFSFSYSLFHYTAEGIEPYPICEYPEIFDLFKYDECDRHETEGEIGITIDCSEEPVVDLEGDGSEFDQRSLDKGEANKKNSNYSISPNPFSDIINIKSKKDIESISILDIYGRTLWHSLYKEKDNLEIELAVENLQSGIFFIRIESQDEMEVIKIIK